MVAMAVAAVGTLLATRHGPGMNPDSSYYLSSGLSLARGDGLRALGGSPMTIFPPGLPALIALGELAGSSPEMTVRVLGATCFSCTVLLGHLLLRRHVATSWIVTVGTLLLGVSVVLLSVAEMAWTEPAFILTTVGLILVLERITLSRRLAAPMMGAAVLVWAAFLLRYSGLALVAAGSITILLSRDPLRRPLRALGAAAGFAALAATIPLLWMARNHRTDGTLMGPRFPSTDAPIETLARFVATLGRWVFPRPTPLALQAAAGAVVATCLLVWLALATQAATRSARDRRQLPARDTTLVALTTFALTYSGYLVAAQLTTAFDEIGTRLMSPLLVPFLVVTLVGLERLLAGRAARWPALAAAAPPVLAVLLVGHSVVFAGHVHTSASDGIGYASTSWQRSPLAAAAAELPADATVYTNAPAGLWAVTRREPLERAPERTVRRSDVQVELSPAFLDDVACTNTYLVWFDDIPGDFLFTPDELTRHVQVEESARTDDGTLYRLRPLATERCGS